MLSNLHHLELKRAYNMSPSLVQLFCTLQNSPGLETLIFDDIAPSAQQAQYQLALPRLRLRNLRVCAISSHRSSLLPLCRLLSTMEAPQCVNFSLTGSTYDWNNRQAPPEVSLIEAATQQLATVVGSIIAASERVAITLVWGGVVITTPLASSSEHATTGLSLHLTLAPGDSHSHWLRALCGNPRKLPTATILIRPGSQPPPVRLKAVLEGPWRVTDLNDQGWISGNSNTADHIVGYLASLSDDSSWRLPELRTLRLSQNVNIDALLGMIQARYGLQSTLAGDDEQDSRGGVWPLVSLILDHNIQSAAPESVDALRRILGEALSFEGAPF